MTSILGIIGSLLAIVIGLWKFFNRKARQKRKQLAEGKKLVEEGIDEADDSKITAGFDRIKRS